MPKAAAIATKAKAAQLHVYLQQTYAMPPKVTRKPLTEKPMNALFNTIQALILYHRNIRKLTFFINGGGNYTEYN